MRSMKEEKPAKNQTKPDEENSGDSWEFFIAKEEMSEHLNAHQSKKNGNSATEKKKWWIVRFFAESNATDWAIALLTAALVIVGYWQWQAISGQLEEMKKGGADTHELAIQAKNQAIESGKANDLAKDALIKVQRAFVIFNDVPDMQLIGANRNQAILFNFWLENSGTTPTRRFEAHINWAYGPNALPNNFTFPDKWPPGEPHVNKFAILGPRAKTPLNAGPISTAIIEKVFLHQMHLYFYGWARYNDVFDKTPRYVTKFCYEMIPAEGKLHLQGGDMRAGFQLVIYGRFNCYDEECKE
jgi:hypothetical protein